MLTRATNAFRGEHDLISRGAASRSLRQARRDRDVAVAENRSRPRAHQHGRRRETIDARGNLVVPGFIDIHTPPARTPGGPPLCLAGGRDRVVDAGSLGADRICRHDCRREVGAPAGPRDDQHRRAVGILPDGDTMDLARADVGAAKDHSKNRDFIVGVKSGVENRDRRQRVSKCSVRAQEVPRPSICR